MANKKLKEVSQLSILDELEQLEPVALNTDPLFKFEDPGTWIYAKFRGRRFEVKTESVDNPSTVLDVQILTSRVDDKDGPTGPHGIFESTTISQIMNEAKLATGDPFYLKFTGTKKVKRGRVKQFAFKRLSEAECAKLESALDDIQA